MANLYWDAYEEGTGWTYDPFEWAIGGIAEGSYSVGGETYPPGPYGIVKAWLEWLGYEEIYDMMAMTAE
jgi:hypothetical protein